MANDKQVIDKISALKGAAESAQRELSKHEASAEQAQSRVQEIEAQLTENGFDPSADLAQQLTAASAEVEAEMAAIATELEGLR